MTKKIKCPSENWFIRLAEGEVTEEQEEKLAFHLENCKKCQSLVDELNDISEYTSSTASDDVSIDTDSKKFNERLSEIKAELPSMSEAAGYMDVMPWLSPAENAIAQVNEFELMEFIGRGGMGVVFKCMDVKLQRHVALKLMSPQLLVDEAARERFLREARSAARINHPNVVTVHAVNEIRGLPYLVMELIEGDSLESKLQQPKSFAFSYVIQIARQSIAGLSAAHQQGVLHRDIKPANIMLDSRSGQAKITDFGLACSMEGSKLTRTGFLVGTPEYLSPEQAAGGKVDERSDLFSMGSVIYAMCSGASPFGSSSMMTTLDNVRSLEPKSLHELNPELPVWFVKVIDRLLQKTPESRFESAAETLLSIESNLTDSKETVPYIDLSSTRKIIQQKHQRQDKFLLAMGLFSIATVLIIATIFWWFYTRKPGNSLPQNISERQQKTEESSSLDDVELSDLNIEELKAGEKIVVSNFNQLVAAMEYPVNEINLLVASGSKLVFPACLEIEGKAVTISTEDDEAANISVAFWNDSAFRVSNGSLELENLEINSIFDEDNIDEDEFAPLIFCEEADVIINQCKIACHELTTCIELENCNGRISNSQLISKEAAILWLPSHDSQQLKVFNSVILSPFAISASSEHQIRLSLEQSTLISESCLIVAIVDFDVKLFFDIDNSILFAFESIIDVDEFDSENEDWGLEDLLERIEFTGSNNRLSPILISGAHDENEKFLEANFAELNQENENNRALNLDVDDDFEFDRLIGRLLGGEFGFLDKLKQFDGVGASLQTIGPR